MIFKKFIQQNWTKGSVGFELVIWGLQARYFYWAMMKSIQNKLTQLKKNI